MAIACLSYRLREVSKLSSRKRHLILSACIIALAVLQIVYVRYLLPHDKETFYDTPLTLFAMYRGNPLLWTGLGALVTGRLTEGRKATWLSRLLLAAGLLALAAYGGMVAYQFLGPDDRFGILINVTLYKSPEFFLFPGMAIGTGVRFRD